MRMTTLLTALTLAGLGSCLIAQDKPVTAARPDPSVALSPSPGGDATPAPIPGLTDKLDLVPKKPSDLLGDPFESATAGIIFRPPAGCKQVPNTEQDHVVDYSDDARQWLLKVSRANLAQPMPLQSTSDQGRERVGLLDYTVQDVMKNNPAAEVLRQEIINVGEYGVGVAILRFNLGTQRYLRQQAIFQASEKLYYIFNFTTPAAKDGKPEDNPNERQAAETFKAMLETIQIVDRGWIKTDQVNRLYRTRAIFTDWNDKGGRRIKQAIVPEQWLRFIRNGKDIGYSYVVEEFVEGTSVKNNPARSFDGVLISVRSRTIEDGNQVDIGSQLFASLDRKHEDWAHVVNVVSNKGQKNEEKKQNSEFGFSELKMTRVLDRDGPRDADDRKAPPGHDVETYRVSVSRPKRDMPWVAGTDAARPEYYTPSPWYIPQATGAMLPRLLPLHRPVTYLFQSYVGDQQQVMHRYVDVGFEKQVKLGGQMVQAIPITDRIRLEGTPTIHYMSPEGKYLGSVNDAAKISIIPTDRATLEKIWINADLTKPEHLEAPSPGR